MAHIIRPDARYHRSYLAALDELREAGETVLHGEGDLVMEPDPSTGFAGWSFTQESLEDPEEFRALVRARRAAELPETPRPAGWVPCTHLWFIDGDDYLGSISLRHELTPFLLDEGGHVGYIVRPSARRQGHATEALRQTLELAHEMGMRRVLLTCEEGNDASRVIIERAGGVYEDSRGGKRRYWVPTIDAGA